MGLGARCEEVGSGVELRLTSAGGQLARRGAQRSCACRGRGRGGGAQAGGSTGGWRTQPLSCLLLCDWQAVEINEGCSVPALF